MWDLRKNYTVYHHDPTPLQAYPYPGTSTQKLGGFSQTWRWPNLSSSKLHLPYVRPHWIGESYLVSGTPTFT